MAGGPPPAGGGEGEVWPDGKNKGELWPTLTGQGGGAAPGPPQQPLAGGGAPVQATVKYSRIPTAEEVAQLPLGSTIETPWGVVQPDENGEPRLIMNEQGKAAYIQAQERAKRSYGPTPFAAIPGAPEPDIAVGTWNFNPFTGMWSR
jgi:hypothetical protein